MCSFHMSLAASNQHHLNRIPKRCVDSLCLWQQVHQHRLSMIPHRCVDSLCHLQQVTNIA
jgi:hypothetical protein